LHFFCGFEFEVFAQIAVGAGDPDLLAVLGDFFVHEFLEFGFAFLQTAPGNDERLALFLDGTWNSVDSNTNVWRMRALCAAKGTDGKPLVPSS